MLTDESDDGDDEFQCLYWSMLADVLLFCLISDLSRDKTGDMCIQYVEDKVKLC